MVLAALLAGCVSPALGENSYQGKALQATSAALSEVATAQLVVEQVLARRLPGPYADETVSASEDALGSIGDSFGAVQPPRESDAVRDEVTDLLEESVGAVEDARIAVRRGDRDALAEVLAELQALTEELGALEDRLR